MGVRIKDLATRAAKLITGNAWLIVDDGGSNVNKIDYKELAKQIIEEYNTSSLGGSAQTVKSAIDALNSKTETVEFGNTTLAREAGDNTETITFTKTYTENPTVLLSVTTGEPTRFIPHVVSRNKTGATIGLYNTGASVSSSTTVAWVAIGK